MADVANAYDFGPPIGVESHELPDVVIARLAERQHGVVARRQLLAAGLTRKAIAHRVRGGRLHCLYRGVYAAGHRLLSAQARWMAAVLAGGPGAVLSHRSAAGLWVIRRWRGGDVDITMPGSRKPRPGIKWHVANLPDDEITSVAGIPVTTVPRTLLDLAAVLDHREVERAINEAEVQRHTDPVSSMPYLPAIGGDAVPRRSARSSRRVASARHSPGASWKSAFCGSSRAGASLGLS